MYVQLATTLTLPETAPGAPLVLNPDSLAQVETGEPGAGSEAAQVLGVVNALGLGCAGGRCSCGGKCKTGLGYFDAGLDVSGWGWQEWATVAGGLYLVGSLISDAGTAARKARGAVRGARRGFRAA